MDKRALPATRKLHIRSWILPSSIFAFAFLTLLFPLLRLSVEPKWDAMDQFLPAFTYLADSLREGRFPLWDPFTNGGYPFHAEPQFLPFNPLAVLLALLVDSPSYGFVWFWVLHWLWGGLGMLCLARHFGATDTGAVAAAFSWALCGFFIGHAQHTSYIVIAAWLPWVFVFAEKAVARSRIAFALLAGAAMGLGALGGYPGLVLFTCLALAIWLVLRYLVTGEDDPRPFGKRAGWVLGTLGAVGILLLLIWAPILNAFFFEGGGYTDRVGALDPETANLGHPFTLTAAVSVFFPFATFVGREWMGADISMTNGYMGILALPLAAFWFLNVRTRRPWWLLVFAVFMVTVSLGGEYGVRSVLYYLYPPMQYMRFSAPFRLYWMLPLVLAAGLAISHLARHPEDRPKLFKILLAWLVGAAGVAAAFWLWVPLSGDQLWPFIPRLYVPGMAVLGVAIFLSLFLSRANGVRSARGLPYMLALLVFIDMSIHLYGNSGTVWQEGKVTERIAPLHQRATIINGAPPPRLPGRPFGYMNAQQILKIPLVQGYVTMQAEGFDQVLCNSRFVEVMCSPVRFWLSPGVEKGGAAEHVLHALSRTGGARPVPVFLEEYPGNLPPGSVVPGTFGRVEIKSYAPERVELSVYVPGDQGAFLASTERFAAGWNVYLDGVPQKVWRTNLYFRGAVVPPGAHILVWKYEPERWLLLTTVSWLSLALAICAAFFILRRERKGEKRSARVS